ncbi:uncharacterized protein BDW43DRAFT_316253 [Aspergillus alliaceus]|uniref:uncharacterized protein n=1 Tax=Petromyces alliaceus TaxID=209559 RepID=UPI0012A749FF|nr:uncharacterized protein BDW43DRAFT_316253 [Aspergillus alliaceus]KAB8228046.1 hypothetical protein BDW43DRAFT_316253 [Aspergillus alliaceus]
MEASNPRGGGLPSASRWMPLSGIPPPPTPTPIYRGAPRSLEMPADLEQDLSNSESSRAPSRASYRSSRSTRSAQSIRKRGGRDQIQLGPSRNSGQALRKQCQAPVESLEDQELEHQLELEEIQAYINQAIEAQIAQQRASKLPYEARIKALEETVQQLQQAQATQVAPPTAPKLPAARKAPQTALTQAPQGPRHPQGQQAEFSA